MKFTYKIIIILIIVIFLHNCSDKKFWLYEKRESTIHNSYPKQQLVLENYVLCSVSENHITDEIVYGSLNEDSLFGVFSNSLKRLSLPISIIDNKEPELDGLIEQLSLPIIISDKSINHCDSTKYENRWIKLKDIDEQTVLNISSTDSSETKIVPFIFRTTIKYRTSHFGPVATIYVNDYISERIRIAVFLIHKNKIIYSRLAVFWDSIKITSDEKYEPYTDPTTQAHWDTLVSKVMEDYIKRLEK